MIDFSTNIKFQTTRSGGKGGQNVNKVETAVIGSLHIESTPLLNEYQKKVINEKLSNRISSDGYLQVKSQTHRTQLENKQEVVDRINELIADALKKKKIRIATKLGRAAKQRRLDSKKRNADIKSGRKKFRKGDY